MNEDLKFKFEGMFVDMEKEQSEKKTFIANCEVCGTKDTNCRNHHLIPVRLLKNIPISKAKQWVYQKAVVCDRCDSFIHPENKLYMKIHSLENSIKVLSERLKNYERENI